MDREPALFRRTLAGYAPANDAAVEMAKRDKIGALVKLVVERPRNPVFLAKYWVTMGMIADNAPDNMPISKSGCDYYAKMVTGHGEWIPNYRTGIPAFNPGSIGFAKMKSDDEFEAFVKAAIAPLCKRFLAGTAPDDVVAQVIGMFE